MQPVEHGPRFTRHDIAGVGIGLRHQHFQHFLEDDPRPEVPWLEVHTENFASTGSTASHILHNIRKDYPLSAHCIGLSLGSPDGVNEQHLATLESFIERYEPTFISDHVSWSGMDSAFLPDLLPLPYTEASLKTLTENIDHVQNRLKRRIAIENPSSYLRFEESDITEYEYVAEAAKRSDCSILLDLNNVHVTCHNHKLDARNFLNAIPAYLVMEIHLAGFTAVTMENERVYIDDHGGPVHEPVWALYKEALQRFPNTPTLIEWDNAVPPLETLLEEKAKADEIFHNTSQDFMMEKRA